MLPLGCLSLRGNSVSFDSTREFTYSFAPFKGRLHKSLRPDRAKRFMGERMTGPYPPCAWWSLYFLGGSTRFAVSTLAAASRFFHHLSVFAAIYVLWSLGDSVISGSSRDLMLCNVSAAVTLLAFNFVWILIAIILITSFIINCNFGMYFCNSKNIFGAASTFLTLV